MANNVYNLSTTASKVFVVFIHQMVETALIHQVLNFLYRREPTDHAVGSSKNFADRSIDMESFIDKRDEARSLRFSCAEGQKVCYMLS